MMVPIYRVSLHFSLIVSMVLSLAMVQAQDSGTEEDQDQIQTLFDPSSHITGFGAVDARFTRIIGQDGIMTGARGGVIFDGHFLLGIGAVGLVTKHVFGGVNPEQDLGLKMGYSGLLLGANIAPKRLIHISIPILIGAGNAEINTETAGGWEIEGNNYSSAFVENSAFLVIEPSVQIEVNVTAFLKIGIGGSYRALHGINFKNNFSNGDLSNWAGHFSVIFGQFL